MKNIFLPAVPGLAGMGLIPLGSPAGTRPGWLTGTAPTLGGFAAIDVTLGSEGVCLGGRGIVAGSALGSGR